MLSGEGRKTPVLWLYNYGCSLFHLFPGSKYVNNEYLVQTI